ncbi:MAG: dTDP-glucose 4,6-dehydratase [Ignavibacteria bacterium CG_4_8_14_3_um_filter_37_9]|nr:NAD-dependent epimerase/dehydratase family protein [Ignavibacteria bacterium]OIO17358.1 MAG: dTDP-glucose 4,6-dehydratase [Ignavibacteria bacterium CG1_02_37_35]PIP79075.1 MAG: dTDP-glucose 4,6-dehydratase [Ignavibacteria bacterium CG22_combo_CG10-13_8_21_14_all_37_15]PIS44900.1 MAG: dTDP-glucose 4,6-dehydratase [Ignavibacteria bacterium CG08_land_8_20_14_0_20_37_9]PIW99060.1 MAG: dTDP-glucose 4,6-dehydratase [Ignavibacteria bacterium CG_4_8_14_3_um_filter_37_9]PIX94138.1 MAG: dTDP-glucose 
MKNIKVVITGGAGFIGSHIVEYWVSKEVEVHVIDNLRSGNIKNIESFKNVHFHEVSITDRDAVFDILENVTYIHHLAAMISVPESIQKPLECVNINIYGLLNVLDAAVKHEAKKIIHSSSAAVYGENPESPKEISMAPKPKSPYGITKLDGEYYLQVYEENYNLKGTALRYFNVFGPRQDPKSQYAAAIPIFISKALKDEPFIIYGDGEQTRDFVYVKDVVQANILAITNEKESGVFNVGRGDAISINQIAKLIISETKSNSKIIYEKARPGDIKHSLASIKLSELHLNYLPKYNLVDGLKDTIKYFVEVFTK